MTVVYLWLWGGIWNTPHSHKYILWQCQSEFVLELAKSDVLFMGFIKFVHFPQQPSPWPLSSPSRFPWGQSCLQQFYWCYSVCVSSTCEDIPRVGNTPHSWRNRAFKNRRRNSDKKRKERTSFWNGIKFTYGIEVQWHGIGTYFACNDILVWLSDSIHIPYLFPVLQNQWSHSGDHSSHWLLSARKVHSAEKGWDSPLTEPKGDQGRWRSPTPCPRPKSATGAKGTDHELTTAREICSVSGNP